MNRDHLDGLIEINEKTRKPMHSLISQYTRMAIEYSNDFWKPSKDDYAKAYTTIREAYGFNNNDGDQ